VQVNRDWLEIRTARRAEERLAPGLRLSTRVVAAPELAPKVAHALACGHSSRGPQTFFEHSLVIPAPQIERCFGSVKTTREMRALPQSVPLRQMDRPTGFFDQP